VHAVKFRDGLAITIEDITERKRHETRLLHMARHDALTGLPNRNMLHERVLQGMEHADRDGGRLAILMVDLDSFKQINDTLGHAAGDRVLSTVASRLKASVRASDSVVRIGGDEFVVVMPDIQRIGDVELCAQRILGNLRRPMLIEACSARVTCSIGVAIYPDNARRLEDLLSQADANMYTVKGASKNNICFMHEHQSA
jgi:diguanylate cyclase (GGDEF)-like protein